MIYLTLAILGACSIGLLFKYSENHGLHRYSITSINYLTASIIALIMSVQANLLPLLGNMSADRLWNRVSDITTNGGTLPVGNSVLWAAIIGALTGFFFLNAFIYYQKGIFESGIALSSMFSRLGVLIPMTVSIIIWQELPSIVQSLGIVLAIVAIVLVNLDLEGKGSLQLRSSLLQLFVFSGAGIFCSKIFQKYSLIEHKGLYLLLTFFTAFVLSLRVLHRKKQGVGRSDVIVGALVGVSNLLTNYFLVMALSQIKAAIVFPISSAGAIITMTLGGVILFGERLRRQDITAISMTIVAVVLINL